MLSLMIMIASACRNSLFDLFTSLSGYVSRVSGCVGYELFVPKRPSIDAQCVDAQPQMHSFL